MDLSLRLRAIAYIIRECAGGRYKMPPAADLSEDTAAENTLRRSVNVADIGCDHGYLGIYLCERDIIGDGRVISCDLREGPLKIAEGNIAESGFSDRIGTRLSDGLEKIKPGEADIITINGMGGELIFDIMKRGKTVLEKASYAVVSPQSKLPAFRYSLRQCNVHILHEEVVYDSGKYYHIFVLGDFDRADFSRLEGFEDPGIGNVSFEDYSGDVASSCIYSEELIKKRRILLDAKTQIRKNMQEGEKDPLRQEIAAGSDSGIQDPSENVYKDSRIAERLKDIEKEMEYIDMILRL